MAPDVLLIVRSEVPEDVREDFDHWYGSDHVILATRILGASRNWRFWSVTDPSIHYAFYQFESAQAALDAQASPGNKDLIAEYDGRWQGRIHRSREIVTAATRYDAP